MTRYQVLFSDNSCVLGSTKAPKQPMLVDNNCKIDWLFTDYLAYRRRFKNAAMNTVRKNAGELTSVLNYLFKTKKFNLELLNNDELEEYIDQNKTGRANRTYDVNRLVNALCWAQNKGIFPKICGSNDTEKGISYPVTAIKTKRKNEYTSDFKRTERKQYKATLADEDDLQVVMDRIQDKFDKVSGSARKDWHSDICERNILMMSLQLDGALRGCEVCSFKIENMPSREATQKAVEDESMLDIFIDNSKGNKSRHVTISALLLSQLWDFIDDGARNGLISGRDKNRGTGFRDQQYVFPSKGNGEAIGTRQLYNIINQGVPGVNPQTLRRNGLTNITIAAIEHLRETKGDGYSDDDANIYAAGIAGHEQPSTTTKHYTKNHRSIGIDQSDKNKPYAVMAKLRKVERENEKLKEVLKKDRLSSGNFFK